jgi:hypothetical protein
MNENMSPHSPSVNYQKKIARDNWANDFVKRQKSIGEQILQQVHPGFNKNQYKQAPPKVHSDDMMRRITALQEAGYITNARVHSPSTSPDTTMVVEFTPAGIEAIVMRKLEPELMDTEFLEDQIVEYQDQIPKAFLEGLKAAEGILRGTDCLENYIETK